MLWRQGDVYIAAIDAIPEDARRLPSLVLAEGEATGHCHRIAEMEQAELLQRGDERFLRVSAASVTLLHDEHAPVTLPAGNYRFWQQREYSPAGIRNVMD